MSVDRQSCVGFGRTFVHVALVDDVADVCKDSLLHLSVTLERTQSTMKKGGCPILTVSSWFHDQYPDRICCDVRLDELSCSHTHHGTALASTFIGSTLLPELLDDLSDPEILCFIVHLVGRLVVALGLENTE